MKDVRLHFLGSSPHLLKLTDLKAAPGVLAASVPGRSLVRALNTGVVVAPEPCCCVCGCSAPQADAEHLRRATPLALLHLSFDLPSIPLVLTERRPGWTGSRCLLP